MWNHQCNKLSVIRLGIFGLYHKTPLARLVHQRLMKPGCVSHNGSPLSFGNPYSLPPVQPQPVTAALSDTGEVFDGLTLGLPSISDLHQNPRGRTGHKASAAHLHGVHLCVPAPILCLDCQICIVQPFPFEGFFDGSFPWDCKLNNKNSLARFGAEDQVQVQVGHYNFRWEGEPLVYVCPHFPIPSCVQRT